MLELDRYELAEWRQATYNRGVPLVYFREQLHLVDEAENEAPTIADLPRKLEPLRDQLWRFWGKTPETFDYRALGNRLWLSELSHLGLEGLYRYWFGQHYSGSFSDEFENTPDGKALFKIKNAAWRWGCFNLGWNELVQFYRGIGAFSFGAGFEVTLDHSTGCNEWGYSEYTRTYLDAPLAFLVYHRGQHVMTIGWVTTPRGVLVAQIQMRQKTGNRWLYRLPCHYVEYTLQRLRDAFPVPVWLTNGADAAEAVWRSYPAEQKPDPWCPDRIAGIYDRELVSLRRGEEWSRMGRVFYQLEAV